MRERLVKSGLTDETGNTIPSGVIFRSARMCWIKATVQASVAALERMNMDEAKDGRDCLQNGIGPSAVTRSFACTIAAIRPERSPGRTPIPSSSEAPSGSLSSSSANDLQAGGCTVALHHLHGTSRVGEIWNVQTGMPSTNSEKPTQPSRRPS